MTEGSTHSKVREAFDLLGIVRKDGQPITDAQLDHLTASMAGAFQTVALQAQEAFTNMIGAFGEFFAACENAGMEVTPLPEDEPQDADPTETQ